ncbi:hypothetical protein HMPREF0758_2093 [Serratia odorifera DSM 4582]|uniref:Uncharacterized protein n=1 Tax=Serratia odorifera DSM 4582 TaxID=667129 RepID=D4E1P3_SEROD|nr:hypothetical protein HMPREF0758_2093 [Serratia odorifera DSM 4582]
MFFAATLTITSKNHSEHLKKPLSWFLVLKKQKNTAFNYKVLLKIKIFIQSWPHLNHQVIMLFLVLYKENKTAPHLL